MARYIDEATLVKAIVRERDKIPLKVPCAPYELLDERPNAFGQAQRAGIRKALRCVSEAPAADVAPKSEVDDWKEIAETYQKMFEDSYSKYQAKVYELNSKLAKCQLDLRYSRNEIAREIFEKIESMLIRYTFDDDYISLGITDEFAELKKKYTENEERR